MLLFGVSLPLPPFVALLLLAMLSPLSRGAGVGAGFFAPTAGRLAGGAGGVGLALATGGRAVPLVVAGGAGTARGGVGRATAGAGTSAR